MLINQVTTRVNEVLGTRGLVPALGEAWAHLCNVQVSLEWCDGVRLAALSKVAGPGRRSLLSPPMASDLPIRAQSCCGRPGRLRRRWLRRGCSAGRMPLLPPAQTGGYGLLEPLAHGTRQVHEQASSNSSGVENVVATVTRTIKLVCSFY